MRSQPSMQPPRLFVPTLTQRVIFGSGVLGLTRLWAQPMVAAHSRQIGS